MKTLEYISPDWTVATNEEEWGFGISSEGYDFIEQDHGTVDGWDDL